MRIAVLSFLVGLLLPASTPPASADGVPEPPFLLDCGPGGERDEDEWRLENDARPRPPREAPLRRLRDLPYTPKRGYGHEGGEGFRHWFAVVAGVWGRPEPDVFARGRFSPESYRFDLPAGSYIVALGFCELEEHLAGRRVFDVRMQGRTVARGLDPFAIAGYAQSFRIARVAQVRGPEGLTVGLRRSAGSRRPPLVNGIWVFPAPGGAAASRGPREVPNVRGFGSYRMNVLFWDHADEPDVMGYIVERRAPGESSFTALTRGPVPVARWLDYDVSPGLAYLYRVRAVDVHDRRGVTSRAVSLEPRDFGESSFPVYSISVSDDDMAALLGNVHLDRTVPATFALGGRDYPVQLRIRGASSRFAAKLSYHVTFVEETPFADRRVIYLKAEPSDPTLEQTKLTSDVFEALGAPAGRASYVTLRLGGRYQGVYLDVERIDRAFLERKGIRGTLFRARSFQRLGGEPGEKRGKYGSRRELPEFIRAINRLDRGELESFVRSRTDWPVLRDYFAVSTLCHRSEIEANDYFYCHVAAQRWILIPWDHNNGNFGVFGTEVRQPFMPLFGQTVEGTGYWNRHWHVLPSRVFHQPALRREYLDRLEQLARDWLVSGQVDRFIAANFVALAPEITVDPFRWPPGDDGPFERSEAQLKRFVRRHGARLLEAIEAERRGPEPAVVINEFQLGAGGGWVELHNRGDSSVLLRGYSVGSLDGAYRPWHRFEHGERLGPGAFRVVSVDYAPRTRLVERDRDLEWQEELERAELEGREPPEREPRRDGPHVPGGTVALVGPLRDPAREGEPGAAARDDGDARGRRADEDAEPELLDWYFFGHQTPGFSYGRTGGAFAFLEPTPGEANGSRAFHPPKLLADGGCRGRRGSALRVSAMVDAASTGETPRGVTLHYSFGGPWREAPMTIENGSDPLRFSAEVRAGSVTREISYYFVARTDAGVERRAPLTAPLETYDHEVEGDD